MSPVATPVEYCQVEVRVTWPGGKVVTMSVGRARDVILGAELVRPEPQDIGGWNRRIWIGTESRLAVRMIAESGDDGYQYVIREYPAGAPPVGDAVKVKPELLAQLVDGDDCSFDHDGGCQAHGYLSLRPGETCPQAELKALLTGVTS